jgi:hypothetical protein
MRKLFVALGLLLTSVSVPADQLLPTSEGTTWEYDSTETLTGAAPARSVVTIRAGKQVLYGIEVIKLETLSGNVVSKFELVHADEDGVTRLARGGKDGQLTKLNPPEPIIVAPLRVDAEWESEGEVEGINMHQHFTVVAEEGVLVPAGKFRAFHLHCENVSLISVKLDRWFVPGTGFVKETTVVRGPGLMQRVTLELNKITSSEATRPTEQQPEASPKSAAAVVPVTTPSEPAASPEEKTAAPSKKLTVEVSGDPAGGSKTEFKSDVAHIYVRWHGHDLPEAARVRVAWVAEDVGDLVEPNFVIDETVTIAPVPNASARFTLGRPPDGWAEGKYRVEFYVDNLLVETVKVTIGK